MNEKRFVLIICGVIVLTLIISITIGISVHNSHKSIELDVDARYSEEEALKVKDMYNTEDMKREFLDVAENISSSVAAKLLDGSVTDTDSLAINIQNINMILSSSDWGALNLLRPTKWIGTWYLDGAGFLKFRFSSKTFEPDWVNDESVFEYIVLN